MPPRDPWEKPPPFDVEKFERMIRKLIVPAVIVIVILIAVSTSFFKVDPAEEAVVLRFGKYTQTVPPGLHFKLPVGIDSALKVNTQKVEKEEFGYRTVQADVRTTYDSTSREEESLMPTGDLALAKVQWVVQYRRSDPYKFLFQLRAPEKTIRDMSEAIVRQIIGDMTITELITQSSESIGVEVKKRLQKNMDKYDSGITITKILFQMVKAPDPVQPAFDDVVKAMQEKETMVRKAKGSYNRVIPETKGKAEKMVKEAEGVAVERVKGSEGDVARYLKLLAEYKTSKEVTRKRLLLETMETILPRLDKVYVMDKEGNILPLLQLEGRKK